MSTLTARSTTRSSAVILTAAVIVALIADSIVALAAVGAGASASYPPLTFPVYGAFSVVGVLVGHLGWRLVRRRARDPKSTLLWLVPVVLLASFIPDVLVLVLGFIPETTVTGAVALMIMHVVVAAVVVPTSARVTPVS